ncbi:MAG TPA: VPDSG-CTERM sorting domain-containing protein [Terrimicrobiaceae bacterium]
MTTNNTSVPGNASFFFWAGTGGWFDSHPADRGYRFVVRGVSASVPDAGSTAALLALGLAEV